MRRGHKEDKVQKPLTVVEGDNVQTVEQLPLILMDSLHLNVKHRVGVDLYFVVLLQVHSKLQLVLLEEVRTSREIHFKFQNPLGH